ncbi:uncharacterized protein BJ171DRAFT_578941 [Polychytrium aggregatum]|uniref:uncharacterized protein n=1 Tax=Polychytrium aggregatum TaxID=110093 RepID=UPI0022FE0543|nr:uncharacterized protein BJ171DRAFT_578941 [Polychytrium aggregatum]KAI9207210.1 hypothetical protein BJ171DRAFT_578941 [Polychytrium aggregatum]
MRATSTSDILSHFTAHADNAERLLDTLASHDNPAGPAHDIREDLKAARQELGEVNLMIAKLTALVKQQANIIDQLMDRRLAATASQTAKAAIPAAEKPQPAKTIDPIHDLPRQVMVIDLLETPQPQRVEVVLPTDTQVRDTLGRSVYHKHLFSTPVGAVCLERQLKRRVDDMSVQQGRAVSKSQYIDLLLSHVTEWRKSGTPQWMSELKLKRRGHSGSQPCSVLDFLEYLFHTIQDDVAQDVLASNSTLVSGSIESIVNVKESIYGNIPSTPLDAVAPSVSTNDSEDLWGY